MKIESDETREALDKRLRRVGGQVRGIQRMLAEDRDCQEISQQLSAVQAALRAATDEFMRANARDCLRRAVTLDESEQAQLVDELFALMARVK